MADKNRYKGIQSLRVLFSILFALFFCMGASGCTVMIVAASSTEDGRPLLFKNRDSSNSYIVNIRVEQQEGYKFIAQYALREETWEGPWGGFNEEGFCIVNSLSYNYSGAEYASMNSVIIGKALSHCKTASDFEALIDGLEKPVDVRANFAIVDAHGNAAFYEVGPNGYTKYDANDPLIAPEGFLVRTNYSLAGDQNRKVGEDRKIAAERFAKEAIMSNQLNGRHIIQNMPRYLIHSNGTDLYDVAPNGWNDETPTNFDGYIPRHSSTNAMLIQGVKDGESPLLTTSWSITGPPIATVALPLFLSADNILPEKAMNCWLSEKGQELKALIFPYKKNATKVIDLSKLYNREETGIMQRILRMEAEIFERGSDLIADARQSGCVSEESLADFYSWLDNYMESEYKYNFDDTITGVPVIEPKAHQHPEWWNIMGIKQVNRQNFRGIIIGRQGKYLLN